MSCKVNGKTKIYGIIGNPVKHSLSPSFQSFLFNKYDINAIYVPFPLDYKEGNFLKWLADLGVQGVNITIPYKEKAYALCSETDETAKLVEAVNTVNFKGEQITGYNTDGPGFWLALENKYKIDYKNTILVVLGNGGSARGIIGAAIKKGINKIKIIARNGDKSRKIINTVNNENISFELIDWDKKNEPIHYEKKLSVIINTTPLGMNGEKLELNFKSYGDNIIVSDIVYNRGKTFFLKEAEKSGFGILEGYNMLVGQGILAFKIWTDIMPDYHEVENFVRSMLYG